MEQNLKLSKYGDDLMEDAGRYAETVGMFPLHDYLHTA
jgi:hypothetical protein